MASLIVRRSDRFPVGTSVGLYPGIDRIHGGKPAGSAAESQTVAADGSLTFTGAGTEGMYQLYAEVGGEIRYLQCGNFDFTPPGNLQARLAKRAAEIV